MNRTQDTLDWGPELERRLAAGLKDRIVNGALTAFLLAGAALALYALAGG